MFLVASHVVSAFTVEIFVKSIDPINESIYHTYMHWDGKMLLQSIHSELYLAENDIQKSEFSLTGQQVVLQKEITRNHYKDSQTSGIQPRQWCSSVDTQVRWSFCPVYAGKPFLLYHPEKEEATFDHMNEAERGEWNSRQEGIQILHDHTTNQRVGGDCSSDKARTVCKTQSIISFCNVQDHITTVLLHRSQPDHK